MTAFTYKEVCVLKQLKSPSHSVGDDMAERLSCPTVAESIGVLSRLYVAHKMSSHTEKI